MLGISRNLCVDRVAINVFGQAESLAIFVSLQGGVRRRLRSKEVNLDPSKHNYARNVLPEDFPFAWSGFFLLLSWHLLFCFRFARLRAWVRFNALLDADLFRISWVRILSFSPRGFCGDVWLLGVFFQFRHLPLKLYLSSGHHPSSASFQRIAS